VDMFRATGVGTRAKSRCFKRSISLVVANCALQALINYRIMVMCMAKDGTSRGGARIGAGQKKKPLADKILEANPGRRKLMVMEFTDTPDMEGQSTPSSREYLAAKQKNGKATLAVEIYEKTWQWLKEFRCVHLIPAQLIEQYAQSGDMWNLLSGTSRQKMWYAATSC